MEQSIRERRAGRDSRAAPWRANAWAILGAWLLFAIAPAGCGGERRTASGSRASTPSGETAAIAPDRLRALSIYWCEAAERVVPVTRYLDPDSGLARGAVLSLLAGPSAEEAARGLTSNVPDGTRLLGLTIRDSIATVDLSGVFESGGGTSAMGMRLAQLFYTLTRVPGVSRVALRLDGRPVHTFSGEGLEIGETLTQDEVADLAPYDLDPPVVITEPVPGSSVGDSVIVRGTANVYEAQVGLRVRGAGGRLVLETWTTATCGTGCRGTFAKSLVLPDSVRGEIAIEAFAPSAKDGSDLHRVRTVVHRVRATPL